MTAPQILRRGNTARKEAQATPPQAKTPPPRGPQERRHDTSSRRSPLAVRCIHSALGFMSMSPSRPRCPRLKVAVGTRGQDARSFHSASPATASQPCIETSDPTSPLPMPLRCGGATACGPGKDEELARHASCRAAARSQLEASEPISKSSTAGEDGQ